MSPIMRTRRANGPEILRLRERIGMSQVALATAAGMTTQGHMSRIEKGTAQPSPRALLRIAAALGVTVEDISDAVDGAA